MTNENDKIEPARRRTAQSRPIEIPNNSLFGIKRPVMISVVSVYVEHDDGSSDTVYSPVIHICLDDGIIHEEKSVSIALSGYLSDEDHIDIMLVAVIDNAQSLFGDVVDAIAVYDVVGDLITTKTVSGITGLFKETVH